MAKELVVHAIWDDAAKVWVATSDDIPGLATEADSWDALGRKLQVMIPELLEENGVSAGTDVAFTIRSESQLIAHRPEVA
jgi:hypothetical protein